MAEKILIIDDDVDTIKLVGLVLQKQGFRIVTAKDGVQGYSQALSEKPDLILLDVMMPEMDGYELARRLRANPETASTPILMFTAKTQLDDKLAGLEAGADDYLTKPTHPSEMIAHVKALLGRSTRGKVQGDTDPAGKKAYTIGILAARGGLGVTALAVNLGAAIRSGTKEDVIVAEMRPGAGTLGLDMGVPDPVTLAVLLGTNPTEMTEQRVKESLYLHDTGLRILPGSVQPKDAVLLDAPAQFERLVSRLVNLASYLILDLGPGLPSVSQKLIKQCNQVILVVEPVPNSVAHAKALYLDLLELGVDQRVIQPVVVNRIRSENQMNWVQVQDQLGLPAIAAVTPAPELYYSAVRDKTTAVDCQANTLTGQQHAKIATHLLDLEKQAA